MKRVSKVVCSLLIAVLIFSMVLTGCGDNSSTTVEPTTSSSPAVSTATAEPEQMDPYEVKWYMMGTKDYAEKNLVQDELAKGLKDINTTLKLQVFPWGAPYSDKISMMIASGEKFDICFQGRDTGYYQNVAKGAFVDLTDLVSTKLPNLSKMMAPQFLEGPKVKGRLYGLATNKEVPEAYGIEVDKEFAEQAGVSFDNVKTYADLEPILIAAKAKLPADVFPMTVQSTTFFKDGTFDSLGDMMIPGVVRMGEDKVINQFETPEQMAFWQLAYKWAKMGLINKNGASAGSPDYWNLRKGLCRVENMGPVPEYGGSQGQVIKRVYIGTKVINTGGTVGAMMCFSKNSPNVDRALLFFDTVNANPELYNLLMYGIEGKHYQVIDANTTPKRVDFLAGQSEDTVGYIHSGGAWSLGGNWFASYLGKNDPVDRNAQVDAFNKAGVASKLLGYSFDASPVKTEVAACMNVFKEMGVALNCGAVDPTTTAPKFIQKLKDAGMDKIIAEKQTQIDKWKSENGK